MRSAARRRVRKSRGEQDVMKSTAATPMPRILVLAIKTIFNTSLAEYLKRGKESGSDMANPAKAKARFDELRVQIDPKAYPAVEALENMAEQRRQLDRQARLHFWLHNWLWVHLPLSVALIILMGVHIFMTLRYWWPS